MSKLFHSFDIFSYICLNKLNNMDEIDNYLEEVVVETGEASDLEQFYAECRTTFQEQNDKDEMWEAMMDILSDTSIEKQKEFWNSFRKDA